ncbi:MAG: extracellular solute-binding protein [Planctomycetota bacterium]
MPLAGPPFSAAQPLYRLATSLLFAFCLLPGCWKPAANEVVVYTALDPEFSKPILADFSKITGIDAQPKFDTEATKTVGLTQAIIAEKDRPQCDVFWNNEILNTLRLKQQGLLEPYEPRAAQAFPAMFRSPEGYWTGFAARARVLVVNTEMLPEAERPQSIRDLADRKWRGRCGIAKPLFGTTATHAACLFAAWGPEEAEKFFEDIQANDVQILAGNKQVALAVAAGRIAFGLTDTDDAIIEIEAGKPVEIVYPDQGEGQLGTLFIPNTVAIIRGGPHPEAARKLVEYVLSPEVEARLAAGPSAQIPLNPSVVTETRVATPKTVRAMEVDFEKAVEHWDAAAEFLKQKFAGE